MRNAKKVGLDIDIEGKDSTAWSVRLNKVEAMKMDRDGSLRRLLEGYGLNTRTMTCREAGKDLVYEGAVAHGDGVSEDIQVTE